MKKLIIIFLAFTSLILHGKDQYNFSNLSLKDGLSQITVLCIYQDSRGFLWFGTRSGLNRFDGYQFDVFMNNSEDSTSISDNSISAITEDKEGYLWIGTNNGLNRIDISTNTFKRFSAGEEASGLSNNSITAVCFDKDNRLWVGTSNGLNIYDKNSDKFRQITDNILMNNPVNAIIENDGKLYIATRKQGIIVYNLASQSIESSPLALRYNINETNGYDVRSVYIDKKGNLWAGTFNNGIICLKDKREGTLHYDRTNGMTSNFVRSIAESPEGNILAGTFSGLNVINPATMLITRYNTYNANRGDLTHYSINDIYFDRSQTLWIGTYGGGIDYYSPYEQKFRFYDPSSDLKSIIGIIGPVVESGNYLYIASEGGGLLEFDKTKETFRHYLPGGDTHEAYNSNILKSLYKDGDKILCGTYLGTVYSFDPRTKKFSLIYDLNETKPIYHISRNSNGDLAIGSVSNKKGIVFINSKGEAKNNFKTGEDNSYFNFPNVRSFLEIDKNIFLIGTKNEGLFYYNANNNSISQYKHNPSDKDSNQIPENYISSIFKDRAGNIWIGTFGGGFCMLDLKTKEFTTFNTKNNLINNSICKIIEDEDGHLWISTIKGISDFDPDTRSFKNYTNTDGIKIDEFTPHSGTTIADNRIVFCGNNGFMIFNPVKMTFNPHIPSVVLGNLYINNIKITPGADDGILTKQLSMQDEVVLKYNQSNLAIDYNALNFVFANRNQYAYMLEGFDLTWNEVGTRRIAYYTNIPPGTYVFRVKGANNDGIWNNQGTSIVIKVLPPFWKTWWAYCLYAIVFVIILTLIYRYFAEKRRMQNDIRLRQAEAKARDEFHQARNSLFTNFSHELRTPLTLIIGPLEDIIDKFSDLNPKIKNNLMLMRSNSRRLLRQVNNLMDFQKKESGTLELKVSESDFIEFSEEMVFCFKDLAASRNIDLEFNRNKSNLVYWFDQNMMEKVYFNILSNAFKNTPNGGKIEVTLNVNSLDELRKTAPGKAEAFENSQIPYLLIEIKDSGTGIEESELSKIFIPFYQVAQNEHSASGTGLGLSLSKSIIELHHGIIWAESPQECGAIFKCILPVSKEYFADDQFIKEHENENSVINDIEITIDEQTDNLNKKKKYTILVVEDNPNVRKYITSLLSDNYNILEAPNGEDAVEKAIFHLPDLVVSDLMMPKMSGLEMCEKIKTDLRTSHIPVIMITACATPDNIKDGYNVGADDYITKPFNSSVLLTRIENILRSREKLKDIYGKRFSLESLGVEAVSMDERFMQKLYAILEENISNPDLNLEVLCQGIGISRANLYRKIKSITNLGPNVFIRNFRLEMAAKMLKETELSISDVYVAVGFNSIAYFSNCFKTLYGVSPSEYVNNSTKNQ